MEQNHWTHIRTIWKDIQPLLERLAYEKSQFSTLHHKVHIWYALLPETYITNYIVTQGAKIFLEASNA